MLSVKIRHHHPACQRAAPVMDRVMRDRFGVGVACPGSSRADIALDLDAALGRDGYRIDDDAGSIRVTGQNPTGLFAGVGRLLRGATVENGAVRFDAWRGESIPVKPARGIYFATHFHNFYHDAPVEDVVRYIEDLALWGCNDLAVWLDMHHYTGIDDPSAQAMIGRLRQFFRAANDMGMGATLLFLADEAWATSPEALHADWRAGQNGYHHEPGGHYHVEICPHAPGGMEYILATRREVFQAFADLDIRNIIIWPYDQGGCTCAACAPWGANGFLQCATPLAAMAREFWPACGVTVSTWYFDRFVDGENTAFRERMETMPRLCERLMVEICDHGGWDLATNGGRAPRGLPLVGFPEISMAGMWPWGGYGANPRPEHWQAQWNRIRDSLDGGYPYSEGIYEDINKVMLLQLEWSPDRPTGDIVREYARGMFGETVADDVVQLARQLESQLRHHALCIADDAGEKKLRHALAACTRENTAASLARMRRIDATLDERARASWRWRLLAIRTALDAELTESGGAQTEMVERLFDELTERFHLGNALPGCVRPPRHPW